MKNIVLLFLIFLSTLLIKFPIRAIETELRELAKIEHNHFIAYGWTPETRRAVFEQQQYVEWREIIKSRREKKSQRRVIIEVTTSLGLAVVSYLITTLK